jgi:VWFA-related protein
VSVALLVAAVLAQTQVPTFESRIDSVYVDVLVKRGDAILSGLTAADFDVRDEAVPQRVSLVERDTIGIHAVLALDVSGSVRGQRLEDLKAAVRAFLSNLQDRDRVTLFAFNHGARLVAGPAAPAAQAEAALATLEAGGGTALHDALLAGLILADAGAGRPALLAFSDGDNRLSWTPPEALRESARASEAVIYTVGAGSLGAAGRSVLEGLADETGGAVREARDGPALRAAFGQILSELRGRYLLRYEPTGVEAPGWHKLDVKLKGRSGQVRARRGYLRR